MFRILIATLFVVHGLIHLLGFTKAFRLADVTQLAQPVTQVAGLFWLAAAALCLMAAGAMFFAPRWSWAFGAAAIVMSQAVIFTSWNDARFGSIPNVVLLVAVVYGFASRGPLSLRAEFERDLTAEWPSTNPESSRSITEADLSALPDPVQRYLRRAGVVGRSAVTDFRATWKGRMRST